MISPAIVSGGQKMAKYLFVYYGGMMARTPEEQQKSMDAWTAWFGKQSKVIVDIGAPTKPGKVVGKNGVRAIGANPITGYTVVEAGDLDVAVSIAKSNPSIPDGGRIAIYEFMPM